MPKVPPPQWCRRPENLSRLTEIPRVLVWLPDTVHSCGTSKLLQIAAGITISNRLVRFRSIRG